MSTAEGVRPDPRITRRRLAVARARRRRLMVRAGGALAGATMVWIVLWSPLLKVKNVVVDGGRHTSAGAVATAAGLTDGDNLLFVSPSRVADRTEELPWVESARVDRLLPNTIRVRVVERSPAMVVTTESGAWLVDDTGHVLAPAEETGDLPAISGTDAGSMEPGDEIARPSLQAAVRALGSMPRELEELVEAGVAPSGERITFTLRDGTQVRYGAAEQLRDKHAVVLALLERFGPAAGEARYFDVRVPSNPAVFGAPR